MRALRTIDIPLTHELLVEGGDARIRLEGGRNEYGCRPYPDPGLAQLGSSTASTISGCAFEAADALHERIAGHGVLGEFERIREEFFSLCGISGIEGLNMLFCASGTDAHQLASGLARPAFTLMVSGSETGRGVPDALSGNEVYRLEIRDHEGRPRDCGKIDEEAMMLVESRVKRKTRVLVVLADVSKTGMIAPSISCVQEMKARFPDEVEVLVDACQFRLTPMTLKAYLGEGFMVAVTGSKFLTGPTFSGALLVPGSRGRIFPSDHGKNIGLLLRWEAALAELRAFRRIPDDVVEGFLSRFADAVRRRLEAAPFFVPLPVPELKRLNSGWDKVQTIFPFRLKGKGGVLDQVAARRIHALLAEDLSGVSEQEAAAFRCSLGQPVSCGALRICSSARLVAEGVGDENAVIGQALLALDKTALLLDL